ncbi:MAG: ABC transporter permease subunit [Acidobacteriia bacterium]|nr:ABC transporter permease subunit [Terriglobia bacterium]MBV8906847.1 ABC transporter permease subunit [Terriglobia bacterium]MBV9743874.1 ABC transporter permease subunit [Terriglobia bacterium]
MLNNPLVIASKEIVDHLRDARSLLSSLMFALMGPVVVGLVSLAPGIKGSAESPIPAMMSVFTLVAAFSGGMNMAIDTIAGERERRSLIPLLLNPVPRADIALGKWLAVSLFALAGLLLNLLGSAVVFAMSGMRLHTSSATFALAAVLAVLPLPLLAAAIQLSLSTFCRAVKEAHTYLSMLIFLPMGVGMSLVFFPAARKPSFAFLPLVGQQLDLQRLMDGRDVPLLQSIVLGYLTLALASALVLLSSKRLHRDEIIYGN